MTAEVIAAAPLGAVWLAAMAVTDARTAYRTCPLCEATCGLELTLEGDRLTRIRGDREDVFSHGFICPKGSALRALHEDPDRHPNAADPRRRGLPRGELGRGVCADRRAAGPDPGRGPQRGGDLPGQPQRPQPVQPALQPGAAARAVDPQRLLGQHRGPVPQADGLGAHVRHGTTIAIPDVDRTDHLLILGRQPDGLQRQPDDRAGHARPAAGDPGPRRQDRRRGPAAHADRRRGRRAPLHPPGHRRAAAVRARARRCSPRIWPTPASGSAPCCTGLDEVRALAEPFTPEAVARGLRHRAPIRSAAWPASSPPRRPRSSTGGSAPAPRSSGPWPAGWSTCSTCSPATSTRPAAPCSRSPPSGPPTPPGSPAAAAGRASAASPAACAGCPSCSASCPRSAWPRRSTRPARARSAPSSPSRATRCSPPPTAPACAAAFESLEFMVAVDVYVNETTRHADVILPAPSPLRRGHYDIAFYGFAVRNIANYSPPVLEPEPELPDEWVTLLRLAGIAFGMGPDADLAALDDGVARTVVAARAGHRAVAAGTGGRATRSWPRSSPRVGPERLLDLMLRAGPYGDGFGARDEGPRLTPGRAGGRSARGRPRSAGRRACPTRCAPPREDRARPRTAHRRCPAPACRAGSRRRRAGADRPPRPALQQLLDAQPARAGQGQGPLHPARAPRRRRAATGSPTARRRG